MFLAPSAESLGLATGGELQQRYLDTATIREAGIFDPLALGALRRGLRLLPAGSNAYGLAEGLLTVAASIHALHKLYCEGFDESAARYAR